MSLKMALTAGALSMVAHGAVLAVIPHLPEKPYLRLPSAASVEMRLVRVTPPRPVTPPPTTPAPPVVKPPAARPPEPVRTPQKPLEPTPPPAAPVEPPPPAAVDPVPAPNVAVEPAPAPPSTAPSPTVTDPAGTVVVVPRRTTPGTPGGTGTGSPNLLLGNAGAARLAIQQGGALKTQAPPDPARPSMLQKAEWKFGGFFARVQDLVRVRFKPLDAFKRRAREDAIAGIVSGKSVVDITLDRTGAIKDVSLEERGPADFLDDEAMRAIRSVGTFVNPPAGLFAEGKATYRFRFTFALSIIPPDKVERFMRSNNNVLEAFKNTFTKDGRENIWCEESVACGQSCSEGQPGVHTRFVPCGAKPR
jgi:TonB family protein